jgi:glycosyltransferase involved in cell wall biosynthesis
MLLSLVVPVYNEEEAIPALMARLRPMMGSLDWECEVVFVNDGSEDGTALILELLSNTDPRIKVLTFSRNFGHQVAITAGLDFASGDAVVVIDADLQDPPELIPDMLRLVGDGFDVVSAQRETRRGDGLFKRSTATAFYWFMRHAVDRRMQSEVGDFRMFSRDAVLAIRRFREQHRFMRGLVAWLGLREVIIPFQREERSYGTTKYPLLKMLQLAWTAVSSFSTLPLRISTNVGFLITLFGLAYFCYSLFVSMVEKTALPGWTSLVCLQIIFSGTILMAVGVVGNYVARIYEESKQRPLYVISGQHNVTAASVPGRGLLLESALTSRQPEDLVYSLLHRAGGNR